MLDTTVGMQGDAHEEFVRNGIRDETDAVFMTVTIVFFATRLFVINCRTMTIICDLLWLQDETPAAVRRDKPLPQWSD